MFVQGGFKCDGMGCCCCFPGPPEGAWKAWPSRRRFRRRPWRRWFWRDRLLEGRECRKGFEILDNCNWIIPQISDRESRGDRVAVEEMPDCVSAYQALGAKRRLLASREDEVVVQ